MVSNTIKFRLHKLTIPSVTQEDKVLHGVQHLTAVIKDTSYSILDAQIQAIKALQDTLVHWAGDTRAPTATIDLPCRTLSSLNQRDPRVPTATPERPPAPRVQSLVQEAPPRLQPISTRDIPNNQSAPKQLGTTTEIDQPVDHRTQFRTTPQAFRVQLVLAAYRKYPAELNNLWCTRISEENT